MKWLQRAAFVKSIPHKIVGRLAIRGARLVLTAPLRADSQPTALPKQSAFARRCSSELRRLRSLVCIRLFEKTNQEGHRLMHRVAFTGAVLLALVAMLGVYVGYYNLAVRVGEYDVPQMAGWVTAGVFGLIAVLLLRWSHADSHS